MEKNKHIMDVYKFMDEEDNEIVVAVDDDDYQVQPKKKRRSTAPRAKNKKQRQDEELDEKLIASGFMTAADLVDLTKQEKLDYWKAFEESLGGGAQSQETVDTLSSTPQSSESRDESRSPEIFDSQPGDVGQPDAEYKPGDSESENDDDRAINLSDDSLLTDDGKSNDEFDLKTTQPNRTRSSSNQRSTTGQVYTTSTNQTPATPEPTNRDRPIETPDESPLFGRDVELKTTADDDSSPTNEELPLATEDQSLGPMFTFECAEIADWPRSPSPVELSDRSRQGLLTIDPMPLFTPPGHCPRQYTQVILQHFNDYLKTLYDYQCQTLPRRQISEPVEVGRALSGTLDAFRKRPRDLSEKLERYYDWRKNGGEPHSSSPEPGGPCRTFSCDVHGTHSISTTLNDSGQQSDSSFEDTPELQVESPGTSSRKRKLEDAGDLPDLDRDEEPKPKRVQVQIDGDGDFVLGKKTLSRSKVIRSDRDLDEKPSDSGSKTLAAAHREKFSTFGQVIGDGLTTVKENFGRLTRGGKKSPDVRKPVPKKTKRVDAKQTQLALDPIDEIDDDFQSLPTRTGATYTRRDRDGISAGVAGYSDEARQGGRSELGGGTSAKRGAGERDAATTSEPRLECPMCYDKFPAHALPEHASDCDGTSQAVLHKHTADFTVHNAVLATPPGKRYILVSVPDSGTNLSRTLRNNKTVESQKCNFCGQHISQNKLEAHLGQCMSKHQAQMERQARAELMATKAAERADASSQERGDETLCEGSEPVVQCSVCSRVYPKTSMELHVAQCSRKVKGRGAESQDLKLAMSDMSENTGDEDVPSIEIHDSSSSDDEPPPEKSRNQSNQRRNHGDEKMVDEDAQTTVQSEGWMGKEEGKAAETSKKTRLRRTVR